MSYDLGLWAARAGVSEEDARQVFASLSAGDYSLVQPHQAIASFRADFTARHPGLLEIDCDESPAHFVLCLRSSFADEVGATIVELAEEHGLLCFDPQADQILVPGGCLSAEPTAPCSCLGKPGAPKGAATWKEYGAAKRHCAAHGAGPSP